MFYLFGALGVLWFLFFVCMCFSNPASHPYISDRERDYLKAELGRLERDKSLRSTPWIPILTSVPVIALVLAEIGHDWGFYSLTSDLPKYMSDVLLYSVLDNGLFTSLPALIMWIVTIASGFLSDWLIAQKYTNITTTRKMFTGLGSVFPAIFVVFASYVDCDRKTAVTMFTLAMGWMGTYHAGMQLNPLDLSPNYAGTLMAISNGIGALTGIAAPLVIGSLITNVSCLSK